MGFLHATEKGKSSAGMVEGAQLELLSRLSSLTGPLLRGLGKAFQFIALAMLPGDGPFPPPSAGIILSIAGDCIVQVLERESDWARNALCSSL